MIRRMIRTIGHSIAVRRAKADNAAYRAYLRSNPPGQWDIVTALELSNRAVASARKAGLIHI